jgi:uncharacterized protein
LDWKGIAMRFDVSEALKSQGHPVGFRFQADLDPMQANGENIVFNKPVMVEGSCIYTGENFWLTGKISSEYTVNCARCLRPLSVALNVDFDEEFAREPSEENPDRYLFQGDVIDLTQMVLDSIALNIPMRHLCRELCRGLCPVCGINLNTEKCSCRLVDQDEDSTRSPFESLQALLHEDNEEV